MGEPVNRLAETGLGSCAEDASIRRMHECCCQQQCRCRRTRCVLFFQTQAAQEAPMDRPTCLSFVAPQEPRRRGLGWLPAPTHWWRPATAAGRLALFALATSVHGCRQDLSGGAVHCAYNPDQFGLRRGFGSYCRLLWPFCAYRRTLVFLKPTAMTMQAVFEALYFVLTAVIRNLKQHSRDVGCETAPLNTFDAKRL